MSTLSDSSNGPSSRTELEVRQLLAHYFQALEQHDQPKFLSSFLESESFTLFKDSENYDWQGFLAFIDGFFQEVTEITFDLERCTVDPIALNAAVATGVFRGMGRLTSSDPVVVRNAFTFVLVEHGDRWCIKHAHESSLPT